MNHSGNLRQTVCGTPLYASPELIRGESYNEKNDLWAVGILAYELLYGKIPFEINKGEELFKIVFRFNKLGNGGYCVSEKYTGFGEF